MMSESKICEGCNEHKELIHFKKRKNRSYTHERICKKCTASGITTKDIRYKNGLKRCSKCKKYLVNDEFNKKTKSGDGLNSYCKKCESQKMKKYRDSMTVELKKERKKKEYQKHKIKSRITSKRWYENNKKRANEVNRIWSKNKMKNDSLFHLKRNLSSVIRMSFNRKVTNGWSKLRKTKDILGCDMQYFRDHIEKQFLNWMTWDNYGNICNLSEFDCSWDLDHIIPVSYAKTEEELHQLNHWSNYQPLCSKVNRYVKKDNIPSVCNIELNIIT